MSTSMREDIVNFERDNDLGGQLTNVAYCPTAYEESTHDNYLLAQVDVLNAPECNEAACPPQDETFT